MIESRLKETYLGSITSIIKIIERVDVMLKVYYCKNCKRIFYLSRHYDTECRRCSNELLRLDIFYSDFILLDIGERSKVINKCLESDK